MTPRSILQIVNVTAFLATLAMNILVNLIPLNGVNTGQVSDYYPNLFTPPGYVFAIWGIIYILALIFVLYQARPSQKDEPYLERIGYFYAGSAVINVTWLALFHYSYGYPPLYYVSVVDLLLLLSVLFLIYTKLDIGGNPVTRGVKLGVHAHISVYLGWISLASIAGIASALNILFPRLSTEVQSLGTAAMIAVAFLLTVLMLVRRRDALFAGVVVWASVGIALKQQAIPIIYYTAAGAALGVVATTYLVPILKKTKLIDYYLS